MASGSGQHPLLQKLDQLDEAVSECFSSSADFSLVEDRLARLESAIQQAPPDVKSEWIGRVKRYRGLVNDRKKEIASKARSELLGDAKESANVGQTSKEQARKDELQAINQAAVRARELAGTMEGMKSRMDEESLQLQKMHQKWYTFGGALASAGAAMGILKRKTEQDGKFVIWAFYFFCACATYVFLRRIKVLAFLYYLFWTSTGFVDFFYRVFYYFYSFVMGVYERIASDGFVKGLNNTIEGWQPPSEQDANNFVIPDAVVEQNNFGEGARESVEL